MKLRCYSRFTGSDVKTESKCDICYDSNISLYYYFCSRRIGDYLNSDNSEELVLDEPKRFTRKLVYQVKYLSVNY